jgi:hypothetical protein
MLPVRRELRVCPVLEDRTSQAEDADIEAVIHEWRAWDLDACLGDIRDDLGLSQDIEADASAEDGVEFNALVVADTTTAGNDLRQRQKTIGADLKTCRVQRL